MLLLHIQQLYVNIRKWYINMVNMDNQTHKHSLMKTIRLKEKKKKTLKANLKHKLQKLIYIEVS